MEENILLNNEINKYTAANFKAQSPFALLPVQDFDRLKSLTATALFYFFSNRYEKITPLHFDAVAAFHRLTKKKFGKYLLPALTLNAYDAIHSESLPLDKERLKKLLHDCKSERFAVDLTAAAIANHLRVTSPFSENDACCNESYEVNGEMTCLRFTDGKHCFFLIQYVSSADGLYFPEANILICLAHVKEIHASRLVGKLIAQFSNVIAYATANNAFHGALTSHERPSHFYYDIWPVLFELNNEASLYQKIPHLYMRAGDNFYDLDGLFEHPSQRLINSEEIDQLAFQQNQWFISIGTNRHLRKSNFCFEQADRFLVDRAVNSPTPVALDKAEQIKGCYPLIWIGVEGQKRCWLEQIDGYTHILNQLNRRFPHLGVVIDGWTKPLSPSSRDDKEADKDRQLGEQIAVRLNPGVRYTFLTGEISHTKLYIGNKIDFFITNFATGSMHVSRLLGKPGFCHLSGELSQSSLQNNLQIHPNRNVYLLPQKFVDDRPVVNASFFDGLKENLFAPLSGTDGKGVFKAKAVQDSGSLSYSIDKKEFYEFIEQRLDRVLDKNAPQKLKFFLEPYFSVSPTVNRYLRMASYNKIINVNAHAPAQSNIVNLGKFTDRYLSQHVIHGMFFYGAHTKLNKTADYLVWLKNPHRRLHHHVQHIVRDAAKKNKVTDLTSILTAGHNELDNHYTRLISGRHVPFGRCTEEMLNLALTHLRHHFVFIGITEQLSESFDRLCSVMDWDRTLFPNELQSDRTQDNPIVFSEEETLLVNKLIQFDLILYNKALALAGELNPQHDSKAERA